MTFLYILGIVVVVIVLLLIIALFLPDGYFIEKSAIIKKPCEFVMDKVADFHNYIQWNPWGQKSDKNDSNITGLSKRPGHKYSWKGSTRGAGSLTLRDIDERHLHFDLEFIKPVRTTAHDNWLFEDWGIDETKVTWQNFGALPYPVGRLKGYMFHKNLNRQFTEGIKNLKKLCER
ncbi:MULTISPECIES: SRPBCC family protein [Niastella]|uniref:SRPBCC family protein n=1 Tax=Niastella soli TaxID=2821487 RepID=A0ABS3YPD0_9BACT|nr:SRPBCC family protein [Niastella soli]MBO9199704.1 SRPBCC family protein [Niastella soli]